VTDPIRSTIIYTHTDEAPALATYSFLPIVTAFAATAGVPVESRDISLAARILAQFPDRLAPDQVVPDALAELGELTADPAAAFGNIDGRLLLTTLAVVVLILGILFLFLIGVFAAIRTTTSG